MKIICKECNAIVPAENINLDQTIAKCSACNAVFNCRDQLADLAGDKSSNAGFSNAYGAKSEVPLPKRMTAGQVDLGYQITLKWFSAKFIFLIVFCLIWDGFIAFFVSLLLSQGEVGFIFFLSLHAMVGIGLTYYTLAGILNTTTITITGDQIAIKIFPLPWFGIKTLSAAGIQQLYCKQRIHRGKNGTTYTYDVLYKTTDSKELKLLTGLSNADQAFFIEQEIEKYLGIKDQFVSGEMPR